MKCSTKILQSCKAKPLKKTTFLLLYVLINLPVLFSPGCEDIVVESISLDTVVPILKWSSQPYGSKWVHRQAMHFLCEEFSQVMTSDVLYELGKEHLVAAIQSDYLQVRGRQMHAHTRMHTCALICTYSLALSSVSRPV